MIIDNNGSFLKTINEYQKIIQAFKKRSDVQNGDAIAYRTNQALTGNYSFGNKPKGIGDALSTTGWCVTASQALLHDGVFQYFLKNNAAAAKLVSINIKERFYGKCYNGSQNIWHTAILVEQSNIYFIIDITCAQFGNDFVGKDIWDLETWERTFRSDKCKHKIFGFKDNPLSIVPEVTKPKFGDIKLADIFDNLKSITSLTDLNRRKILNFFTDKMFSINDKILLKSLTTNDMAYVEEVNELLEQMPFKKIEKGYSVLLFNTKQALCNFVERSLKKFGDEDYFMINTNLFLYESLDKYFEQKTYSPCVYDKERLFNSSGNNEYYLILEVNNPYLIDSNPIEEDTIFVPFGHQFKLVDIYNNNDRNNNNSFDNNEKSHTSVIVLEEFII